MQIFERCVVERNSGRVLCTLHSPKLFISSTNRILSRRVYININPFLGRRGRGAGGKTKRPFLSCGCNTFVTRNHAQRPLQTTRCFPVTTSTPSTTPTLSFLRGPDMYNRLIQVLNLLETLFEETL